MIHIIVGPNKKNKQIQLMHIITTVFMLFALMTIITPPPPRISKWTCYVLHFYGIYSKFKSMKPL